MTSWPPKWTQASRRSPWHAAALAVLALLLIGSFVRLGLGAAATGWNGTWRPDPSLDKTGDRAAVASDSKICSQMGLDVLKSGGNAADAAVTVALCIGVVDPQSSGIGGGGFITVRLANGTAFVIDARETAPAAATKHMFDSDAILSKYTGLASGVPGELAGLEKLWEMAGSHGRWADLVTPVAELSRDGFLLGESTAKAAQSFPQLMETLGYSDYFEQRMDGSNWCWLYGDQERCAAEANRGSPEADCLIRRPELAETLFTVAREGAHAFYHGDIPEHLCRATKAAGGILTPADFADYSVIVRPALHGRFDGLEFVTAPAPASGPPLVMGLRVIDELRHDSVDTETQVHRMVETMKWMAAARSELGDPAFVRSPRADAITSEEWARAVIGNISDSHTLDSWRDYHPSYEMNEPHGTTHFSIVDEQGNAVAMTTTVNLLFGNGVCDSKTGVVMNSEMDDFSTPVRRNLFELAPSIYNFVEPGKRPLSSTVPTIMYNGTTGEVDLVVGAAGGSRILTSVFLAVCRMYGESRVSGLDAVAAPRYHHQLIPEVISLEPGFDSKLVKSLEAKGHEIEYSVPRTALNLVRREGGKWHAVSDFYRKRGLGAAY